MKKNHKPKREISGVEDPQDLGREVATFFHLTPTNYFDHTDVGSFLAHPDNEGRENEPHPVRWFTSFDSSSTNACSASWTARGRFFVRNGLTARYEGSRKTWPTDEWIAWMLLITIEAVRLSKGYVFVCC